MLAGKVTETALKRMKHIQGGGADLRGDCKGSRSLLPGRGQLLEGGEEQEKEGHPENVELMGRVREKGSHIRETKNWNGLEAKRG